LIRLPIFAADIPPIRESAGEQAYLFDPGGDPSTVARQIISYLDQDKGYKFKHHVMDNYSWDSIVSGVVLPLLKEVVNGK
jgi:hypothetical protein